MQKQMTSNIESTLQTATEDLDVFSRSETSRLEVGEDGRLIAAKESRLERVVGLARCYIGPIFSEQVRKEQEQKLVDLKKAVLRAREFIQRHSALIVKFKEGDESQRKLAELALLAIQRYNEVIAQETTDANKADYNYERQRLLSDQEIKGQPIELPHVVSVKYDSHPQTGHSAQKMLKELSQTLISGAAKKNNSSLSPTHKKNMQFMIDTFQMKVIRMIETHLQKPIAEIVPFVKQTTPKIDEDSSSDLIHMQQLIEVDAGSVILVTGCFKRNLDPKFMTMPILDSFRLSFQLTHTGFPYPSQHTGWSLADKWIDASPLRTHQTPLFQQVNQRRKRLAHQLLFDQDFNQKVRRHFKIKRDIFDQNRHIFLPLYRQLQQALLQGTSNQDAHLCQEAFYQELNCATSAFDLLTHTQQQILDLFIKQPIDALEEEWLEATVTPLRTGSPQEKLQAACSKLEQHRHQIKKQLDEAHSQSDFLLQQGFLLSEAIQCVGLQYQSEKMGFCPPLLNDFSRKLQACAFQQLLTFLDECDEQRLDVLDPAQIKSDLLVAWSKDLQLLEANHEDEQALPIAIVNELERYFNARFYEGIK